MFKVGQAAVSRLGLFFKNRNPLGEVVVFPDFPRQFIQLRVRHGLKLTKLRVKLLVVDLALLVQLRKQVGRVLAVRQIYPYQRQATSYKGYDDSVTQLQSLQFFPHQYMA